MAGSFVPAPTRSLVVKSMNKDDACYFVVMSGPGHDAFNLKTTRFSELCKLHAAIVQEMGSKFQARLPRKTFRRSTDPTFIETRRGDIELYLRVASATAGQCAAFKKFFQQGVPPPPAEPATAPPASQSFEAMDSYAVMPPAVLESAASAMSEYTEDKEDDDSADDEDELSGRSFNMELLESLDQKQEFAKKATETVRDLQNQIATGDQAMEEKHLSAKATAGSAKAAASVLYTHRYVLNDLDAEIAKNKSVHAVKRHEQGTAAKRLEEEVASSKVTTAKSRARYEAATKAILDHDKAHGENLAKLESAVVDAEAALAGVVEQKAAINAGLSGMQGRVKSASAATATGERERDARAEAVALLATESAAADAGLSAAEERRKICVADIADHSEKTAVRARTNDLLVRRANERLILAEKIRDLRSRGAIGGEDRAVIEEAEMRAKTEADDAAEALQAAEQKRRETMNADEAEAVRLTALGDQAASNMKNRDRIATALRGRLAEVQTGLRQVEANVASLKAIERSAVGELELLQKRMGEDIAAAENACIENLAAAKKAVVDLKQKADEERTDLKHTEEAEQAVLSRQEVEDVSLVKSCNEAQVTAAEADDYAEDYVKLSEQLVKDELAAVEAVIAHHEKVENTALKDADKVAETWAEEKETIKANLHRASLQAARAQKDVEAARALRKSLVAAKKS
eukprot:TRINITY_DN235_c0_g1_i4.p1 TRINITY_DN235_c0_g1~~TRINITY_DN235_c0_g1_i4.p1  ORF type:complete len:710 (-),score=195.53 TRINITY_DN235_c0_g1_i4:103-2181(-)